MDIAAAYILSVFGGWLFLAFGMDVLRRSIGVERELFKPLDFWLGATERATATTLVILAPSYLAAFVGGWVALKFAAKWQRSTEPLVGDRSLLALIGGVWSFAVAIAAGVRVNPSALEIFRSAGA